jgi:hypothetical protein
MVPGIEALSTPMHDAKLGMPQIAEASLVHKAEQVFKSRWVADNSASFWSRCAPLDTLFDKLI